MERVNFDRSPHIKVAPNLSSKQATQTRSLLKTPASRLSTIGYPPIMAKQSFFGDWSWR